MKILIAGGYPHHLMKAIGEEIGRRGNEVAYFDSSPESPWHRPFVKPIRKLIHNLRFKRHPQTFEHTAISNIGWRSRRWVKAVRSYSPDLTLLLRGNRFDFPWLSEAMKISPHVVWYLEPPDRLNKFIDEIRLGNYRKILCYSHALTEKLQVNGIPATFFPHPSPHLLSVSEMKGSVRKYDWVFLGSHSPWRERLFERLLEVYPNAYIQGPRWDRVSRRNHLFKKAVNQGYFGTDEIKYLYSQAKVGVDCFDSEKCDGYGITMRAPELLGCGTPFVTQKSLEWDHISWGNSSFVRPFQTPTECLEGVRHYMEIPRDELWWNSISNSAQGLFGYSKFVDMITEA